MIVIGGVAVGVLAYLVRRDGALVRIDRSIAQWGFDHATASRAGACARSRTSASRAS